MKYDGGCVSIALVTKHHAIFKTGKCPLMKPVDLRWLTLWNYQARNVYAHTTKLISDRFYVLIAVQVAAALIAQQK